MGTGCIDVSQPVVNSTIISDSIILWTSDDSTESFFELVNCIHRFISFCHNKPMISLRGGLPLMNSIMIIVALLMAKIL